MVEPHGAVRLATTSDVPSLVALMSSFYGESGYPLPEDAAARAFGELISRPALGCVLVAEGAGGDALGHLVLTYSWSMEYGGLRAFIDDLYVRPDARGRGVGRALLGAAEGEARLREAGALLVEVGDGNEAGLRAYHAAGYEDTAHVLLTRTLGVPLHLQ